VKRVQDKQILKLIHGYLDAGVMEHGSLSQTEEGTPQGGPISQLLGYILLTDFDRELEHRGTLFRAIRR